MQHFHVFAVPAIGESGHRRPVSLIVAESDGLEDARSKQRPEETASAAQIAKRIRVFL